MKTIVLSDDIYIEKLDGNYILQSKRSARYCLVNSDAYCMISMLPQMTDIEKDELYRSNTTLMDRPGGAAHCAAPPGLSV